MIVELMERYPIEVEYVQNLIHKLSVEGCWSDLDFASNAAGWAQEYTLLEFLNYLKYIGTRTMFYISLRKWQRLFIKH